MESCSLGKRRSSLQPKKNAVNSVHLHLILLCLRKEFCGLTCVLKEEQCWTILCSSSWTSSTHRRLGSSRRLICRFTNSSKDTSGTKSAGRGPCKQNDINTLQHNYWPAVPLSKTTWVEFRLKNLQQTECQCSPWRCGWQWGYQVQSVLLGGQWTAACGQKSREKCNRSEHPHSCKKDDVNCDPVFFSLTRIINKKIEKATSIYWHLLIADNPRRHRTHWMYKKKS